MFVCGPGFGCGKAGVEVMPGQTVIVEPTQLAEVAPDGADSGYSYARGREDHDAYLAAKAKAEAEGRGAELEAETLRRVGEIHTDPVVESPSSYGKLFNGKG